MKRIRNLTDYYRRKAKEPSNTLLTFSSLISTQVKALSAFIIHCKDIASLIVKEGTTFSITDLTMRRRKHLDLPPIEVNQVDSKKLAAVTGLSKILEDPK